MTGGNVTDFPPGFKPAWEDKVVDMVLFSTSDTDLTYERPNGTRYVLEIRKEKDDYYYTPDYQLPLFNTKPEPLQYDKVMTYKPQLPMIVDGKIEPWPHRR